MKTSRAPLILAIILLLLPVLYIGSYLALVIPGGEVVVPAAVTLPFPHPVTRTYKLGGEWAEAVFWPLEQIDRMIRPSAWERISWESYPPGQGKLVPDAIRRVSWVSDIRDSSILSLV
jgi:hypothetical protein